MVSLDDLTKPLTRQQVQESIYDVMALLGASTTSWKPGAVVRTFVVATSVVIAAFSRLIAAIARSGWLELAEGEWLTLAAWYVFRVKREEATFATGEVTLTNTGGGLYEVDPEDIVFSSPITKRTYRNTAGFTLGPGESVTVPIRATEVGAASTAPPGTITELETPLLGVGVTNELAVVGQDAEEDPALRTRCYEKLGSLSDNGPSDAYAFAARNARRADGTRIGVTRVKVLRDGMGGVEVVCATASGSVEGSAADPSTDLGAVHVACQEQAATLNDTLTTKSATASVVTVAYSLWVYDDVVATDAQLEEQIRRALTSFMAGQPIGGNFVYPGPGKVFLSALNAVVGGVRPEIFRVVFDTPTTDVEFGTTEAPVLGTVTQVAVHRIPREVI